MNNLTLCIALILTFILGNTVYGNDYESLNETNNSVMTGDTIKPGKKDTTDIKFKNKKIRIIEDEEGTNIEVKKEDKDRRKKEYEEFDDDEEFFEIDFGDDSEGFDAHWAGFEFGLNNFLNKDYKMSLPESMEYMKLNTGKSWNINLNLIEYDHHLIGKGFGIATGMGLEFNDYRFDNLLPVHKTNGSIGPDSTYANNAYNVEKAKLSTTYITVPLLLELQTPINRDNDKLYITAGVIGGLKIGSHTKVKYNDADGDTKKDKNRGDFYLSPFRYGYTVRAGVGFVKLYANYYATPLFEKDKAEQINPFAIGLVVSF
jgi:hypothetical protein